MNKITLKEYADIKQSTIEDIVKYAAEKGIAIPNKPDYILNESLLKNIDPIFYFNQKHPSSKKVEHQQLSEIAMKEQNQTVPISPKTEKEKTPKIPKRIIGKVKFFDSNKGFGFAVTGSFGISENAEDKNKIFECYIHGNKWKSNSSPFENEWIVFTPKKERKGWSAVNAERLSFDKEGLLIAMPYRGDFAKIKGEDSKGVTHNYNVICHIITTIKNNELDSSQIIINAFTEYLSQYKSEQLKYIIPQFLSDSSLNNEMISLLPKLKTFNGNDPSQRNAIKTLIDEIEQSIFSKMDISIFNYLPVDFDFCSYIEQTIAVIERSLKKDLVGVNRWLKDHQNFLFCLKSHVNSLSFELMYVLYDFNKDISLFVNCDKPWKELYDGLKEKSEKIATDYLCTYFANRDNTFVVQSNLKTTLDESFIIKFVNILLKEPTLYSAVFHELAAVFASKNLKIISSYINNGIDISHVYCFLSDYLNTLIKEKEKEVREFLKFCINKKISVSEIVKKGAKYSDEMLVELFALTANIEYLNLIDNFDTVPKWLNDHDSKLVFLFLQSCQKALTNDEDKEGIADTIQKIEDEKFYDAIKDLNVNEQYQILQVCPNDYARTIVTEYYKQTELFDSIIREQWEQLKSKIPYVAFDLESDGESIREFAFRSQGTTKAYQGEGQHQTLLYALNNTEIIVGHRIKEWDLGTILTQRGYESNAFVWDTLEIEILLNPCRYSYALHTGHTAQEDTELADRLFWNQLFRLSKNSDLCTKLKGFLPEKINEILFQLQKPCFATYFQQSEITDEQFFQTLHEIDDNIIEKLRSINNDNSSSKCLIIAPKRLWTRISEYVNLSFVQPQDSIDYQSINIDELQSNPLDDIFLNTILKRFVSLSKTPIVANIAQYIRINYLLDDLLRDNYVKKPNGNIDCADMDFIMCKDNIVKYNKIYFIGCEIENRVNQFTLPSTYSPSDFWNISSSIPMRLGASSYLAITQEERQLLIFADVPTDAVNIWIEKTRRGEYVINYNYDFYAKLKSIEEKNGETFHVVTIPWTIQTDDYKNIVLIHSERDKGFDAVEKRVPATSIYRATYWTYQFALLKKVPNKQPKILFLDDTLEKDQVEQYARRCGFYVPTDGSLVRKLELITHNSSGMLVVGKEQFFEVVNLRKDAPYCYVWDHLAVEKHMMMWHGFTNERNKSFLHDGIAEKGSELNVGSTKDTYQSVLLSLWPVYEYYFRFIKANSIESSMLVLDSFMEEYHTLSSVWGVSSLGIQKIWDDENSFNDELATTREIFSDKSLDNNDIDIEKAMAVILETLVRTENVTDPQWTDIQKEILPQILTKEDNVLVSLPTGGGKSVLFQGPALYKASYTNKLSIVVTPLKALMQDQVKELEEKGFITNVDYLNGDRSVQEVQSVYRKINGGEIALLYVTPERFRSRAFLNALTIRMANDHGLEYMIFDEAHCISQWGMEFRPDYLNVINKCKEFQEIYGKNMCIAMFSATVTDMIYNQINETIPIKRLGQENDKKIYNPIRSHIGLEFKKVNHNIQSRIKEIVKYIQEKNIDPKKSRMLIFCKKREQCEEVSMLLADILTRRGILNPNTANQAVGYYHAGMDGNDREDIYTRFKDENDPLYILCATKAFGMGMDIPNIHYIVHLMPPNVLEDYLQEVGRAGRNKKMYEAADFSTDCPIPTVCLCSDEDIKKAKEQLIQSTLSWNNLEEIRIVINSYISKIQSLEKTKEYPIVVPNTLWKNNNFDYTFTNFKIGRYWLERMGRIKMGYLSPAHICITILDETNNQTTTLPQTSNGKYAIKILDELRLIQRKQKSTNIQVSLQKLSANLSIYSIKILDCLILLEKHKIITIEEKTRCHFAFTRLSEINYMLSQNSHEVAFHIIIKAARVLLSNNELKVEKSYSLSDIRQLIEDVDSLQEIVKDVTTTDANGDPTTKKYMTWYNEEDKQKNKGLSIAESYHDDLYKKRLRQVLYLLELIPNVKVQSYLDTERKCVLQSVIVENDTWEEFLNSFKIDCIRVLEYVNKQSQEKVSWSKMIIELGLEDKGFAYFDNVLSYLKGMAYLTIDPLLPTGIEIYTTDNSENAISENIDDTSNDYSNKQAFDEVDEIRTLRPCVMDILTTKIKSKEEFQDLITAYFSITNVAGFMALMSKYYEESDPMMDAIRATAIKNAEEKLKDNPEQWAIYNESSIVNVNVEAGPGSGKTHILTLKCAKLIYHQHVNPQSILVLAYNRAVVIELKSRLANLFASLGLSRSASQLHVYTFHSLAKRICGEAALREYEINKWERILLNTIKKNPNEVRAAMPDIKYVLIDEFQDITQTRLNAMFGLTKIYEQPKFFTIGDKDQSIYGFERVENNESMDPNCYYEALYKTLHSKKMTMRTNYRSYPKILEAAKHYLPETSQVPIPCKNNKEDEPQNKYVFINEGEDWANDFERHVNDLKEQNITDLAVFFRTNNEVYHGYSQIRTLNIPGTRIRIQGASACELFRMREIYAVLKFLDDNGCEKLKFGDGGTETTLYNEINSLINNRENWDTFYIDFAFVLILDYLDFAEADEESHTYGDMADSIRETLKEENPQLYKIYDDKRFSNRRIIQDPQMNIVLTTMHKVKGLEFDAVMITPSVTSLPFNSITDINDPLSPNEIEQIQEEQRLLYVAYTRAKKFLFVYKGEREKSVENLTRFASCEGQWGVRERESALDRYNIGYNANHFNFRNNNWIAENVKRNNPVSIVKIVRNQFSFFEIRYEDRTIGQLSSNSDIRRYMIRENIDSLSGFFVSDVFCWTYEDTLAADERANREGREQNFAANWCDEARDRGYIFIVNIAGYGN